MNLNGYDPIYPFEGCELTSSELSKTKRNVWQFVNELLVLPLSSEGNVPAQVTQVDEIEASPLIRLIGSD